MTRYNNPAMKKLADQQVRFAPRDVCIEQAEKAEKFLEQIQPDTEYLYHDVCKNITNYKTDLYPALKLTSSELLHDLRCLIEDLSDSADIDSSEVGEKVYTVNEVSEKYSVSTKTVDRWRNRGLVSRKFRFGQRKRIGFLESSLKRFAVKHPTELNRGSKFSQLSDDEKLQIINKARRFARYGGCPAEISRRIGKRMKRSPETIRYTLKNYDKEHPESAIFPNSSNPLSDEQRREIFRSYRRGIPAERLARNYCRTKTSIFRIVSEVRANRLIDQPVDYMDSDEFRMKNADKIILGPPPQVDKKASRVKTPPGLPPYLASLYSVPLLTREEEQYYFRKMNFLKFKASELRSSLNNSRPKAKDMDQIEDYLEQSIAVKNFLIRSNLRLVVSIAKKHNRPGRNFFEMVSDGNMSLIRAIEKFDYTQGNKFSTYSSWAIMKNFARSIPAENTQLDRFRTGKEDVFQYSKDDRANHFQQELVNKQQQSAIGEILKKLDQREKDIIICRFGLNQGSEPQTLEQIGSQFGVTKERIRQLEARALKKLRKIATDKHIDIPGI